METPHQGEIVRGLRRLTIAVWALTSVIAVLVAIYVVSYIRTISFIGSRSIVSSTKSSVPVPPDSSFENFYALPLERQIVAASVIALARYQTDGDRKKCVISEIMKHAPNTAFYYNVRDEFRECSYYPKPDEGRGDGVLLFFAGNPAGLVYSTTFEGDRLLGMGDMPIEQLRKEVKQAGSPERSAR